MAKPKKRKYQIKGRVASSATPKESTPAEKILEQTRKDLKRCIDCEAEQRGLMLDDLKFATLDQWPGDIRKERENDVENGPRPCLTVDKYSQYRTQVVNDMRQGKPGINVRPQDDQADVETAKILKGLIRNIEDQSSADIAYMNAGGSAVDIGLGFFRITTEYASDDSFDQEIFIRPVPNTFSVYLAEHLMPDGSDAELGYIAEAMPKAKFEAEYPKAKSQNKDFDGLDSDLLAYWKTEDTITVVEEYRIEKTTRELVYLADGTTITAEDYAAWPERGRREADREGPAHVHRSPTQVAQDDCGRNSRRARPSGEIHPDRRGDRPRDVHWREARPLGPRSAREGFAADVQLLVEHHHREDGARAQDAVHRRRRPVRHTDRALEEGEPRQLLLPRVRPDR
jgi:hypothetical protein